MEVPNCSSLRLGCDQKSQMEKKLYRNIEMSLRLGEGLRYLAVDYLLRKKILITDIQISIYQTKNCIKSNNLY